jgi:hypothetical protein
MENSLMPRHYKVLGFLLVTILGVYGCAKAPGNSAPTESNATTAKAQKLEEDYRAAVAARDQFRQKLVAAEQQQANTQRELEQARNEAKARTGERDAVNAQYETFRKNLKELLGTADASLSALNLPAPKPSSEHAAQK